MRRMNELTAGPVTFPLTFETIEQVTQTVNRVVDYLGIRDRLVARMAEIDRDFGALRDSRNDMLLEREKQRASTDMIVQGLMDRGEHELALRAFEAFMNASPNLSAAVVQVIRDRLELNPVNIVTQS